MVPAQEPLAERADVAKTGAGAGARAGARAGEGAGTADGADDVDELLVEEISIDGMCGVY